MSKKSLDKLPVVGGLFMTVENAGMNSPLLLPGGYATFITSLPAVFKKVVMRLSKTVEGVSKRNLLHHLYLSRDIGHKNNLTHSVPIIHSLHSSAHKVYLIRIDEWSYKMSVKYNPKVFYVEELTYLFDCAGLSEGIGCRRVGEGQAYGSFSVKEVTKMTEKRLAS